MARVSVPVVGEFVAARMAKHVAVGKEREASGRTSASDHALIASHAESR
jgi:hypothetical protein